MQNNIETSTEPTESPSLKTPTENALFRLAEILIKIDQREHIVDREHLTEEALDD